MFFVRSVFYYLAVIFSSPPFYPLSSYWNFQFHFRADWLPMIGARQLSGLNYWSLLIAAYPTREDLNTMRAERAGVIANSGIDEYQELTSKGFLP